MKTFQLITRRITIEPGIVTVQAETLADALNSLMFTAHQFEITQTHKEVRFESPTVYAVDGEWVKKGDLV